MFRVTWTSLLQRKLRLILSTLAVVLGVMFVAGAFVLTDTLGRSFDRLFATAYEHVDVEVTGRPPVTSDATDVGFVPANLPDSVVRAVRGVDGVATASGVVNVDGVRVVGADGRVVNSGGSPRLGANWSDTDQLLVLRDGHRPAAADEVAMNAALVDAAGLRLGDRVGILTLHQPKRSFELVGIFGYIGGRDSIGGAHMVVFTEPVAQEVMLGERDVFSAIAVTAEEGVPPEVLRDRIRAELGDAYDVRTGAEAAAELATGLRDFLTFFNRVLLGFAGVALFVGTFVIVNTFSITVAQRTRELALMRAIGASRRQLIGAVLGEALVIGVLASAAGLGAGIGVGALLAQLIGGSDLELAGLGVPPSAVIGAFAVGILVTLVAAVIPALRAARVPPVAALRWAATPDRPLTTVTVVGSAVIAAGVTVLGLGLRGPTLAAVLGGVLLSFVGAALLAPAIARPVVSGLGRLFSRSVPGKLGRRNAGRNPRRTAITASALMVGIALITGVTTVVSSATASLDALVADRVGVDLIISGEQGGGRPPTFDAAVLDRAAALPGVRDVAGVYYDLAVIDGNQTVLLATGSLPTLRDVLSYGTVAGSLDDLSSGQIVVDEQTAQATGVQVGQSVTVQMSRGAPHRFRVSGIYDAGDLTGGWLISTADIADFGVRQPAQALIRLDPDASADAVRAQIDALLADSPEVSVGDRTAYVEQQASSVDDLLAMIQILLALAILIAVLGIVNTLALSILERTRELGLLRAVGLSRGQAMRMVAVEAVVISVFGALLGVVVGAGLGAVVVRALQSEGITMLSLPWPQMATYLVLAGIVGVLASVMPAIRAARTNVLTAIAHE